MGREILFRAKHIHVLPENEHLDGSWVYGYLSDRNYINSPELEGEFLIDEDTICQYTGLTDKNGNKIFEGDIVKFEDVGEEGYEYKEGFDYTNMAKVIWNKGRYELDSFFDDNSAVLGSMNECPDEFYTMFEQSEVIGNIFDNPELLEVEECVTQEVKQE